VAILGRMIRALLSRALLVLALGTLSLPARADSSSESSPAVLFARACQALEAGDLDAASRDLLSLRHALPERPEPLLLDSLLSLRRTRSDLGWREAFLLAWHRLGRPDFSDSPLLSDDPPALPSGPRPEELWARPLPDAQRFFLAFFHAPKREAVPALLQHLPVLSHPEFLVSALDTLSRAELPPAPHAQARAALRARLAAFSADYPQAMQLRALLLLEGSDSRAPFSRRELAELEALSRLEDWRPSDFLSLYQHALGHLESSGVSLPDHYAYTVAVLSLVGSELQLLQQRAEASRHTLSPSERLRLAESLWRIGARLADESSILERLLGLSLMEKAATELDDSDRILHVSELRARDRAASSAWRSASSLRWPLPSLRRELIESSMRDEVAHMRAFLP
jgi:hypothetical protein